MTMAHNTSPQKNRRTYFFSVEGFTEKWYLEWLAKQINASGDSKYTVIFKVEVQKDPVSCVKKLTIRE